MQGAQVRELDPTGRNYDQEQLNLKKKNIKKKESEVNPPSSGHTTHLLIQSFYNFKPIIKIVLCNVVN